MSFRLAVSALVESILRRRCCPHAEAPRDGHPQPDDPERSLEKVVQFVLEQHARMPDYLRLPLAALTLVFDASAIPFSGRFFHSLSPQRRRRQVLAWKQSRLGFRRDLIRFYENLAIFAWYAEVYQSLDS